MSPVALALNLMAHHVDHAVQTDVSSAENLKWLSNSNPNMDYALENMQKDSGSLGGIVPHLGNTLVQIKDKFATDACGNILYEE